MFISTRRAIGRRTVLRGLGAAVALPLLDGMIPALSAAAKSPMRLGFFYVPNGFYLPHIHPEGAGGKNFAFSRILAPMEPLRQQMVYISGLSNSLANRAEGGAPHTRAHSSWLTGLKPGPNGTLAKTIDQYAADKLGEDTPLRSLELTTEKTAVSGGGVFENATSWRSATQPLVHESNPRAVFRRLFGDGGSTEERIAQMQANRSLLDSVLGAWRRLRVDLGPSDRLVVNDYLDAVREVERRIELTEARNASSELPQIDQPAGIPASYDEHVSILMDLLALAYQADITRVCCMQLAREVSNRTYPEIGVPEAHHTVSHHMQGEPSLVEQNTKINTYHMSLFARFAQKLRDTRDGDGTLLDHAILMHGSGLGDGDRHTPVNLPVTLVGGGAGSLQGNRHLVYSMDTPAMNLGLSLLGKVGVDIENLRLADSTGPLVDL